MSGFMKVKIWGDEGKVHPEFKAEGTPEKVYPKVKEYCEQGLGIKSRLSDFKAVLEVVPGKTILDAKVRLDIKPIKEK